MKRKATCRDHHEMGLRGLAFIGSVHGPYCAANPPNLRQERTQRSHEVKQEISEEQRKHGILIGAVVAFLLLALPLAVWLDLTELNKTALRRQTADLNSVISSVRSYYASNVVGRVLANPNGATKVVHNYKSDPRRDPDPGDAVAGARPGHRRAAGEHHLPLRLGLPVPEPRPAPARQVRKGCAGRAARRSRAEDRRHRDFAVLRQGPPGRARHDGPGLRQLPQQPP